MRLWLATGAVGLAACSFEPSGIALPSLGDDVEPVIDARVLDAPPGALDAPPTCPDTDGDGVCNDVDRCNGHDDRDDLDADGLPDACDDWDCGPTKPTVTLPVDLGGGLTISATSIGGGGAVEELDRNNVSAFAVQFRWSDPDGGERDQLELGVAGGARLDCRSPLDEIAGWTVPPIPFGTGSSHRAVMLTGQLVHENNCSSGPRDNGWAGTAPSAPVIGYICVR